MKKYIWFGIDTYYPSGGLGDIRGQFDDLNEATLAFESSECNRNYVVDRDTWEKVWDDD